MKRERRARVTRSKAPRPRRPPQDEAQELRASLQALLRCSCNLSAARSAGQELSTSHARALMCLLGAPPPTQQELGAALGIDKSNVTRLCHRMERLGQVEQCRCEQDGRARRLHLTAAGRRAARAVSTDSGQRFAQVIAAIPAPARPALLSSLRLLVEAVRQVSAGERGGRS